MAVNAKSDGGSRVPMTRAMFVSPLARAIDMSAAWNATDGDVAERFDASYRTGIGRAPQGAVALRGLPFAFGVRGERRWLLLDREVVVPIGPAANATHLIVAHFCDSWRDDDGVRPAGSPAGWPLGAGETVATYEVCDERGSVATFEIHRRHEIADGIIGWGSLPFAAVGHRSDAVLDWRGPHRRLPRGRYPAAGQAGALGVLPGSWGVSQTGVADFVPSADDEITLWLHAIALPAGSRPVEVWLRPAARRRSGSDVVVAGLTLFDGSDSPLRVGPRRQIRIDGFGGRVPDVDLGIAIRARPPADRDRTETPAVFGWGSTPLDAVDQAPSPGGSVVDVAVARDARLRLARWEVSVADLEPGGASRDGIRIQPLPAADIRVSVELLDTASATLVPARVRFVAGDGRYLPPLGHRDEVNPGIYEDTGADLVLGHETFAYVPGQFEIDLPLGTVDIEVIRGFESRPVRRSVDVDANTRNLRLPVERAVDLRDAGWMSADPHVHFLAPSTALLQAAAEDVALVHLLATQWGDQFTSVTDLPWGDVADPAGRHAVIVGTENRQNMLGHVGLLGAHPPVLPLASGGAPEGRIGGAVSELMADWMDRCRASGGVVIASHFPLPYAEIASDIVMGKVDAVEMQSFPAAFDTPSILEWYRFLNCGYRLPVVGGTDKMSAEIPLGSVRTYARVEPGEPPTFATWSSALRAGRTFASSGPLIEFAVDGHEPGDVITLPSRGGRLEARARARAAQPMITAIELVLNGVVVADVTSDAATESLDLAASIDVSEGAWMAARVRSNQQINSGFTSSMAAHSSPVYVEVAGRPLFAPADAEAILAVVDGTLCWLRDAAAITRPAERERMVEFVRGSAALLRNRVANADRGSRE